LEVVTEGMLSQRLKELESAGLVQRRVIGDQLAVAMWPLEQQLHDERRPPLAQQVHRGLEALAQARGVGSLHHAESITPRIPVRTKASVAT